MMKNFPLVGMELAIHKKLVENCGMIYSTDLYLIAFYLVQKWINRNGKKWINLNKSLFINFI